MEEQVFMSNMSFAIIENDELNSINGGGFWEGVTAVLTGIGAVATGIAVMAAAPAAAAACAVGAAFIIAGQGAFAFGLGDMCGADNIRF